MAVVTAAVVVVVVVVLGRHIGTHDRVRVAIEVGGRERLGEEVGVIVGRVLILDDDVSLGDPLADLEKTTLDVARALRALAPLRELDRALVVSTQSTVGLLMS